MPPPAIPPGAEAPWLVIVNPAAGRPDGGAAWRGIARSLQAAGVAFHSVQTDHPGHGAAIARRALQEGRRRIAALGGDGSVNDVVHGIMDAGLDDTRTVTIAVLPHGTGNDWARSLGITCDPAQIARVMAAGRSVLHDVGVIDFPGSDQPRRWFINVAGAGYDAWVTEHVPRPVPSAFTYLGIALRGLARYRSPQFTVTAGEARFEGRMLLAFVANAQFCGNRMHVAPTASVDDGLLDVLAVRELSLLQALPKLGKLYTGRILGDPAVRHARAPRVRIETRPVATIQADGQIVGRTPAQFSVLRQALRVVVP